MGDGKHSEREFQKSESGRAFEKKNSENKKVERSYGKESKGGHGNCSLNFSL